MKLFQLVLVSNKFFSLKHLNLIHTTYSEHLLPLLHDLRCCSAVSKTFRRVTLALEAEQTAVSRGQLEGRFARRLDKVLVVLRALPNLRALDLTQAGWADGRLLAQLPRTCPRLATLILSGIDCLFDADVAPLAACRELKEIDLTFCQKTSYGSVIALRRPEPSVAEGPPPALLRIKRLPPWLCGAFECPLLTGPPLHSSFLVNEDVCASQQDRENS